MGGRGSKGARGSGKTNGDAILASIKSTIEQSDIIQDGIHYGLSSPFQSAYWVSALEDEISREAFNRGEEITIKQVDNIVSQLKTYVEKERERIKAEREEEAEKTRLAKEYFARTYNQNRGQREITSSTYRRADKALRKHADSVLGISRKYRNPK